MSESQWRNSGAEGIEAMDRFADRAPTEREPRTEAGRAFIEKLRRDDEGFQRLTSGRFHLGAVVYDAQQAILAIEEEAAASPSCSSCHHPIHDFGDVGECPCGCIENPATETGGLPLLHDNDEDRELLERIAHSFANWAPFHTKEWASSVIAAIKSERSRPERMRAIYDRLRSPSVGEDAQT